MRELDLDISDGNYSSKYPKKSDFVKDGVPFIRADNIRDGLVVWSDMKYISPAKHHELQKGHLKKNDILITTRGEIGKIARVGDEFIDSNINAQIVRINTKNVLDSRYFFYYLWDKSRKGFFQSIQTGTALQQLPIGQLRSVDLELPENITDQKRIAAVLSAFDDKIELNNKISAVLEQMAQAIFKKWFVNFRFPGHEKTEFVESELGRIPKWWKVKMLPEVFDFLEGPGIRNWQYVPKGCPFINIRLIQNNDIDIKSASFISEKEANGKYKHFRLKERDMVVSTSGTLGRSAIIRKEHLPLLLNTSVIGFRPKDGQSYGFMYQFLNAAYFQNKVSSMASGSAQPNFGPVHLKQIEVLMPNQKVLEMFSEAVNPVYEKIITNMSESKKLAALRDLLLPKLMSGEIRV